MRIYEVVDAQGQLGLLRIIIDNTWTAIAQQADEQRKAAEQRLALTKAKAKPNSKKGRKGAKASSVSPPLPTPLPTPSQPTPNKLSAAQQQPAAFTQLRQQPQNNAASDKNAPGFSPNSVSKMSVKPPYTTTKTDFYKDIDSAKNDENEADRHSRNGLRIVKK